MLHVYGTSHVSEDSLELIEEKMEEHDPDVVALELDPGRLNALLSDETASGGSIFSRLLVKFQRRIGEKTGVMPGEEMLRAYELAGEMGAEVGLIDQEIGVTLSRLGDVSRKEKVRAGLDLAGAFLLSGRLDYSEIPDQDEIDMLLERLESRYPGIYRVLVEERNEYMAGALEALREDRPDAEILAFVGAGHREEVRRLVGESGS